MLKSLIYSNLIISERAGLKFSTLLGSYENMNEDRGSKVISYLQNSESTLMGCVQMKVMKGLDTLSNQHCALLDTLQ